MKVNNSERLVLGFTVEQDEITKRDVRNSLAEFSEVEGQLARVRSDIDLLAFELIYVGGTPRPETV